MVTPELIEYIKEHRRKGILDETIRATLIENAWSHKDVDEAYETIYRATLPPEVASPAPKASFANILAKIIFLPASVLVVFWLGMLIYRHVL